MEFLDWRGWKREKQADAEAGACGEETRRLLHENESLHLASGRCAAPLRSSYSGVPGCEGRPCEPRRTREGEVACWWRSD